MLRISCPKIFSVLGIFKYNPGETDNKFITSQLFLSSVIVPTSSKRRITVYGFGHSLWSAISCQRKWLTSVAWSGEFWRQLQDVENINNVSPNFSKVSLSHSLSLPLRQINATNIRLIVGGAAPCTFICRYPACIIITTGCLSCEAKGKRSYQMYAASQHLVRVAVWLFDFPRAERSGSEPYTYVYIYLRGALRF